jgi:hypothetical protein
LAQSVYLHIKKEEKRESVYMKWEENIWNFIEMIEVIRHGQILQVFIVTIRIKLLTCYTS